MAKKVAPSADARGSMPPPPERIPPGTIVHVDHATGAWEVLSLARLERAQLVSRESTGRARTIASLDPVGRARARANRVEGARKTNRATAPTTKARRSRLARLWRQNTESGDPMTPSEAARRLEVDRTTIYADLKSLGLSRTYRG